MNINEKDAILGYLEFHLIKLCENVEPHMLPNHINEIYEQSYSIINDFEQTLQSQVEIGYLNTKTNS